MRLQVVGVSTCRWAYPAAGYPRRLSSLRNLAASMHPTTTQRHGARGSQHEEKRDGRGLATGATRTSAGAGATPAPLRTRGRVSASRTAIPASRANAAGSAVERPDRRLRRRSHRERRGQSIGWHHYADARSQALRPGPGQRGGHKIDLVAARKLPGSCSKKRRSANDFQEIRAAPGRSRRGTRS